MGDRPTEEEIVSAHQAVVRMVRPAPGVDPEDIAQEAVLEALVDFDSSRGTFTAWTRIKALQLLSEQSRRNHEEFYGDGEALERARIKREQTDPLHRVPLSAREQLEATDEEQERRKAKRSTAAKWDEGRTAVVVPDRYPEPLPPLLEMAIDMWIGVGYRLNLAKKKERAEVAVKARKTVNNLAPGADLHSILSDQDIFPEAWKDIWRIIRPERFEDLPAVLATLDRLVNLDDPHMAGVPVTGNKANAYRDRVIHEALRWQAEGGPEATGARLAHAITDRICEIDVAGHFDLTDDDDGKGAVPTADIIPRVVSLVFGFAFKDKDPLETLRSSLGDRLADLAAKK